MPGRINKKRSFFEIQLLTIVLINILSLAIVSGLLYSNFVNDYKDNLIAVMHTKANLLASASSAAILFQDNDAATEVLSALNEIPATRFAQIFDADKNLFAEFKRPLEVVDIDRFTLESGTFFQNENIYLAEDIIFDNEKIGFIFISADTETLKAQQARYASTVVIAFLASLFLGYILNWRMQKVLTAPLRKMASLIGDVAERREYDQRLDVTTFEEISVLSDGVNSMLDTIEEHEKHLQENAQRLESLVQELFERAHYDALTNLPNRHLLMDRLSHSIETATRANSRSALLFLDLDRFKVINDSLGHPLGDEVLISVANKLRKLVRKADSICRWGGDEFVVLLENVKHEDDIHMVAQKIIKQLAVPSIIQGHQLHISTCIGIATFPENGRDAVTLLKHADISMYQAKDRGPGHYCFFDSTMLADSVLRLAMETSVRQALERKELYLVYQPQIHINTGAVDGLEALTRWNKDGEMVSPDLFLPVVEELGLMRQFSLWVLGEACRQSKEWQMQGLAPVKIAVNLPVSFIMHSQCVASIESVLQENGLSPEYLEVEITENSYLSSASYAVEVLQALHDMGIKVVIDDFGTGYSCMSYLRDLPISSLKIDGSFVHKLGHGQANDGIVQSIITLGRSLDVVLVAECVETQEQLNILTEMDCDIIQGYYFSEALTADDTALYLKKHST
jgi:diguanylate cyclase (GGDEF)-like protein